MSIVRRLPNSNPTRRAALKTGKNKMDHPPSYGSVYTTATKNRLNAIIVLYLAAWAARVLAEQAAVAKTSAKNAARDVARMWLSHFIQALNNGIDRGEFDDTDRAFYNIDVNSGAVPIMDGETALLDIGQDIIDGEAARIAAGGIAIPFPLIADVQIKYDLFKLRNTEQSNTTDELDIKQEAIDALNSEADKVIKKMWDETETFFNEETIESKRQNAREWGVVYMDDSVLRTISGLTKLATTSALLADITAAIDESGETVVTLADGIFAIQTTDTGVVHLHFSGPGVQDKTIEVALAGTNIVVGDVLLDPVV